MEYLNSFQKTTNHSIDDSSRTMTPTDNTIEDPDDLTDEDRATLRELAESDRDSSWVYQKVLKRIQEIQEERSE